MPGPTFAPGFRFSPSDAVVLIVGGGGAAVGGYNVPWVGFVVGYVVGHFFLFCNVFRVSRRLELIWAAVFVALAGATVVWQSPRWPVTIAVSMFVTVVVIAAEMRKPSYHGVGWRRLNPELLRWWDEHAAHEGD